MVRNDEVVGVILAGGRSTRMGSHKADIEIGGVPMGRLVARSLGAVTDRVVAAGGSVADLDVIGDTGLAHRGPLAGLAAAAAAFPRGLLVVVATDQPWVRSTTLVHLVERADRLPVVPVDGGVRQTTCAAYPAGALAGIDEELSGGGSVQSLLDRVAFDPVVEADWQPWGEDGRSWFSVDSPDDIQAGIERFGLP